jgi:hypothetical protein
LLTFNLPAGFVRPPAAGLSSSLMWLTCNIHTYKARKMRLHVQIRALLLSKSVTRGIITATEMSDTWRAPYRYIFTCTLGVQRDRSSAPENTCPRRTSSQVGTQLAFPYCGKREHPPHAMEHFI